MKKNRLTLEFDQRSYDSIHLLKERLSETSIIGVIKKSLATMDLITLHDNEFFMKLEDGTLEKVRVL